jgi:4'-phosphopantetheinyl transferase EntD
VTTTTPADSDVDRQRSAAALSLVRSGWRSVPVVRGDALAALWPAAARGSTGFAWRAAMAETVAGGHR